MIVSVSSWGGEESRSLVGETTGTGWKGFITSGSNRGLGKMAVDTGLDLSFLLVLLLRRGTASVEVDEILIIEASFCFFCSRLAGRGVTSIPESGEKGRCGKGDDAYSTPTTTNLQSAPILHCTTRYTRHT